MIRINIRFQKGSDPIVAFKVHWPFSKQWKTRWYFIFLLTAKMRQGNKKGIPRHKHSLTNKQLLTDSYFLPLKMVKEDLLMPNWGSSHFWKKKIRWHQNSDQNSGRKSRWPQLLKKYCLIQTGLNRMQEVDILDAKGQLISESLFCILNFQKNQRKIWQIFAIETKKWSNQQST